MAISSQFRDHVLDLLEPFGAVSAKAMMGGAGLFREGNMFALIAGDVLFFKADDVNRGEYEAAGMKRHGRMPYYRVPPEVFEDRDELCAWADRAFGAALRARKGKPGKKKARG